MKNASDAIAHPDKLEQGFGLIEIIVSMFLLALLAVAFLPVLIQSMKVTATNVTIAAATQLVSQDIEDARTKGSVCANLEAYVAETIPPVIDGRGVSIQVHRQPVVCPSAAAGYPTSVRLSVYATRTGDATQLAGATTLVSVSARS
ncbi:prepilin-type N-terminal cleavage/methylation domain-containing protein [Leifsonia sp. Root112D2]|uniref:prepilin-type N-terminal cleavage/methylation domain-containing protein n=1 Tax=Leifsonia sp. Root112D2 TaxID=1736426 RepID=UPI0006F6C9B3|nr:prepilin-type N-terminal cleavage/methylation domain-containing protein [Leifsonia sp. Root112D2]KQV07149.1 hypothetical protein ASC63_07475 [Leifsonia sp. Root112D2]